MIFIVLKLFRHYLIPLELLILLFLSHCKVSRLILEELARENWLPYNGASLLLNALGFPWSTFGGHHLLLRGSYDCAVENLFELRLIIPAMRVHIVSLKVVTINGSTVCRFCVPVSISMECRLAEIGCKS